MVKEMFSTNKICNLYKNTYGKFVLNKAFLLLSSDEKNDIKEHVQKKLMINCKNNNKFKELMELF